MGRHSSSSQGPFYRSVIGWVLPWALGAVVAGAGVLIAVDAIGSDELDKPPRSAAPSTGTEPGESSSAEPSPTSPAPKGRGKEPHASRRRPRPGPRALITDGVTVQVLNSTLVAGAAASLARQLQELGFDVDAVGDALRGYERTTVFWSVESVRPAAQRLARRFGWRSAPRAATLSPAIDLHVVIGSDGV